MNALSAKELIDSAELGIAEAQAELSERYFYGIDGFDVDHISSLQWALRAAEAGDKVGQFRAGWALEEGQGTTQDLVAAMKWYELAAAQGRFDSCYNIGNIFWRGGVGVERDYAKAVLWWQKDADGGHPKAQFSLGRCYLKGEGISKDLAVARDWFKKSADQGNNDAMFELGAMIFTGEGGSKDLKLGMGLISDSRDRGNEKAASMCEKLENEIRRHW